MPVLAAVLFAAACSSDSKSTTEPVVVSTAANVRFFNATTDMTGSGGFTTNGQFATGSAVAFGQATSACSKLEAGTASFGFGAANTGGTALNGVAITTLNTQTIAAKGNYTLATAGPATNAKLYLLNNNFDFASSLGNQAAVRFVNLAPGTGTSANIFNVLTGTIGSSPTALIESNVTVGEPTPFKTVPSGSNAYTVLIGHLIDTVSNITLNLQAGSVTTIGIVPNPTSGGFQLISIPPCS